MDFASDLFDPVHIPIEAYFEGVYVEKSAKITV